MGEGTIDSGRPVAAEPETIRAEMAQTRAALTLKLGVLKSYLFDSPATKKGKQTMTVKKAAASRTKKKTTRSTKTTAKKAASQVVDKTKKVLGKMLAGAAVGAVKGAAEAVLPEDEQEEPAPKTKKTKK